MWENRAVPNCIERNLRVLTSIHNREYKLLQLNGQVDVEQTHVFRTEKGS